MGLRKIPADIPEGFATVANFRKQNVSRSKRLLISLSFAVPTLAGATVGYWTVRGQPEIVKMCLLAFTAGILLAVAVEEMIVQAHHATAGRNEDDSWESIAPVTGLVARRDAWRAEWRVQRVWAPKFNILH